MRIHWATFDADDAGSGTGKYNQENCAYAAKVFMANLRSLNEGQEPIRFWCEKGTFRK